MLAQTTLGRRSRSVTRSFSRRGGSIRRQFTIRGGDRTTPRGRVATPYGVEKKSGAPSQPVTAPPVTPSVTKRANPTFQSGPKRMRVGG